MPSKQIANPFGYGGATQDGGGFEYFEAEVGATAVTVGCVVKFTSGVATGVVIPAATAVTNICGISLDAGAPGALVRVVSSGYLPSVPVSSAGVTALDVLTAGTAGVLTTDGSPAVGTTVAVALETVAGSGSGPVLVKLC